MGLNPSTTRRLVVYYDFFTPIPCTFTSLPLDGMARNDYFFNYLDTQEHTIYLVWIHFFPTSYARAHLSFE